MQTVVDSDLDAGKDSSEEQVNEVEHVERIHFVSSSCCIGTYIKYIVPYASGKDGDIRETNDPSRIDHRVPLD
jgi:hypothetical protein